MPRPRAAAFRPAPALRAPAAPRRTRDDVLRLPRTRRASLRALRRSLRASTAEGAFAEVVAASTSTAVTTGWALHLGAGPGVVALLAAASSIAQIMHLPGAVLTSRLGARRVALRAVAASRLVFVLLAALPFLDLSTATKIVVLLAVTGTSSALAVVGNNAWTSWMSELVPARLRGRYFGQRTAGCTLVGTACGLLVGRVLDLGGGPAPAEAALAVLATVAALAGGATTLCMARQQDAPAPPQAPVRPSSFARPFLDAHARGPLAYAAVWGAATGLGTTFFALYVLDDLHLGFTLLAMHGAAIALTRATLAPWWGRRLDTLGARRLLAVTSAGLALLPLLWLVAGRGALWPLALDALLTGVFASGQSLASFALPMVTAPRTERSFYVASFALAGGLPAALAASVGGALASSLPERLDLWGQPAYSVSLLFVGTSLLRLAAVALVLRLPDPARTRGPVPPAGPGNACARRPHLL